MKASKAFNAATTPTSADSLSALPTPQLAPSQANVALPADIVSNGTSNSLKPSHGFKESDAQKESSHLETVAQEDKDVPVPGTMPEEPVKPRDSQSHHSTLLGLVLTLISQ